VITLVVVGLVSGMITAVSPCVLPVLPAILSTSLQDGAANRRRPLVVVAGLVTSFAVVTVLGGAVIGALNLPDDILRWAGIVTLLVVGLGLAVPAVGHVLERPFQNTRIPQLNRDGNGFVMGLALGLVFVPCAGPILAAITVLSATNGLSWGLAVLTLSFSLGIAIPLLFFGFAGQAVGVRIKAVRTHLGAMRITSGVILMLTAVVIATNLAEPLQRAVPGVLANAQESIEGRDGVRAELDQLAGREAEQADPLGRYISFTECSYFTAELNNCGPERGLHGIGAWLNTPNGEPLSMEELRGKVVLLDFWTYSCINCQRTIPYQTAWYEKYKDQGLVVIGVHTPEFAFEKVESNVAAAIERYGVNYPVALDNGYETWEAWDQRYWPSHYLIDQGGTVRQVHWGEGGYGDTERLIQELLDAPPEPTVESTYQYTLTYNRTPEIYIGYTWGRNTVNEPIVRDQAAVYVSPEIARGNHFSFNGTWTVGPEAGTAGPDAGMVVYFYAAEANMVLGGTGTVTVEVEGDPSSRRTFDVSGTPDLYTVWNGEPNGVILNLEFSEGVEAYTFTFG
jgi:cytochrome c biogenesis protein CcdA/thiol-disulfide isomerase/thioredoxin